MVTTAAKFWFAVFFLALVGAFAYAFPAGGEWFGTMVLGTISLAALLLGVLAVALRDSVDTEVRVDEVVARNALPAGWPALLALGGGMAIIGLAGKNALLYLGIAIIAITFLEWMVQGWAERATGDRAYNQSLRDRIMAPLEIPVLALIVILFVLAAFSRVLLAVDKDAATGIAIAVPLVIFVVAILVVARPKVGSSVLAGLLALGAVVLLAAGIVGGIAGQRDFEHHGDERAGDTGAEGEQGNNAVEDEGGEDQSDPGADPSGAPTDGESSDTGGDIDAETGADDENNSTPASVP
jgi:hypothetical protein